MTGGPDATNGREATSTLETTNGRQATSQQRARLRWPWVVVVIVTSAVLVGPTAFCGWAWLLHQTRSEEVMLDHPITALELHAPSATVALIPGPPGVVRVRSTLSWTLDEPRTVTSWRSDTLTIDAGCHETATLTGLDCSADLEVQVPAQVAVRASVDSGDLTAQQLSGPLHLQATSGALTLTGTRGRLWARVGSGLIEATSLGSTSVDVGTRSGSIDLTFAGAPDRIEAAVASGSLVIVVPSGSRYRVTSSTGSGGTDVDPRLEDANSPRIIDVSAVSGAVNIGLPSP